MLNDEISEWAAEVEGLEDRVGIATKNMSAEAGGGKGRDGPGVAKLRRGVVRWSEGEEEGGTRTFSKPNCFPSAVHGIGMGFGRGVSDTVLTGWVKEIHFPMTTMVERSRNGMEGERKGYEVIWDGGLWTWPCPDPFTLSGVFPPRFFSTRFSFPVQSKMNSSRTPSVSMSAIPN